MTKTKLGLLAAISIVMANMIGTGVFTSLGFQLIDIQDYRAILLLWTVGGALALLGSFCYAELSSSFPKSGGEYHFLNLSMGRTVGFLSGWTSAVLGFAAPIAAASHAFAQYFAHLIPFSIEPLYLSTGIILIISAVHSLSLQTGARFQVLFTVGKIGLLIAFIFFGLYLSLREGSVAGTQLLVKGDLSQQVGQAGFWVGLIFVSYAYSGWNASAYMIDEIRNPVRNVPRSIIYGTVIVLILYTALNFTFLLAAPVQQLAGKPDVAFVAAENLFSQHGAMIVSSLIAFFLISTISSMVLVGPRVIHRIAEDNPELKFLSQETDRSTPVRAIWLTDHHREAVDLAAPV